MTLGQIIKAYRETNSMSMDDFSKASKISKGYISQLENNLNPKTGEQLGRRQRRLRRSLRASLRPGLCYLLIAASCIIPCTHGCRGWTKKRRRTWCGSSRRREKPKQT